MGKKYKKKITLFLMDGEPEGRITAELSNWTGKAYKIPRTMLKECGDREELKRPAVYVLFGKPDTSDDKPLAYIGETEDPLSRLKQHLEKEFWNEAIVFISKDGNLNKAHIKYMELKLFTVASDINRYILENSSKPAVSSVSEADEAELEEFIDNICVLTSTLGYKIFEPLQVVDSETGKVDESSLLYINAAEGDENRAVHATGRSTAEGFVVLRGSKVAKEISNSMGNWAKGYVKLRNSLVEKNAIDESWIFTEDTLFNSPSAAACVVMGRNANGLSEWKNLDGVSLKELEMLNSENE